jgi:2-polyprenyl-3-methyl-5-hydroxy-6-metoxy-1,4-benzoquinol methylase
MSNMLSLSSIIDRWSVIHRARLLRFHRGRPGYRNPYGLLAGLVREGMTVCEPDCAEGHFTIPLAKMVGVSGRVISMDSRPERLAVAGKRAIQSDVMDRITWRLTGIDRLDISDLSGRVDLVLSTGPEGSSGDYKSYCRELWDLLKDGGTLIMLAPRGYDAGLFFAGVMQTACATGFRVQDKPPSGRKEMLMMRKLLHAPAGPAPDASHSFAGLTDHAPL